MNKAIDIAKYCIYYCSQKIGKPITNLQLQKILYYVQAAFMYEKDERCFEDSISAWKYGPVVENVYYHLRKFSSQKMSIKEHELNIKDEDIKLIEKVCDAKAAKTAGELVAATHEEDPWKETEQEQFISEEKIRSYFKENSDRLYQ